MKGILASTLLILTAALISNNSLAASKQFPEKGWHKGPYLAANLGMMQLTNDDNILTDKKFDGNFNFSFGLTFGWDIADWIGPMLQVNYATTTSEVGTGLPATKDGITYPASNFPIENARERAIDFSLFAKATLPYFTHADWQPKAIKILPYLKLGGTGHIVYINAPTNGNKAGGYGGGPAIGGGMEFFFRKGFFIALDATENFIIQKSEYGDLTDSLGLTHNAKITQNGLKPQFMFYGMIGWHF